MDIEKLIERLRTESLYKDKATLEIMDLCMDAATTLSTIQAENKRLKSLLSESGQDLWSKENQRADCLEAQNEKLRAESIMHHNAADNYWHELNEYRQERNEALAELEQVKHQRDSYRMYHDDLASKPNCNTCADKDCKYRPIPGDTVRANCPLWRGPEEGEQNG